MPSESLDAMAGAMATLEARAQAENPDNDHRLVKSFRYPDIYAVCSCGTRVDAATEDQLVQLHRDHAEAERKSKVYRPAARRHMPAIRESLQAAADRKGGKA